MPRRGGTTGVSSQGATTTGKASRGSTFRRSGILPKTAPTLCTGANLRAKSGYDRERGCWSSPATAPARVPDREEFSRLRELLIEPDCRECVTGLAAFDRCIELLQDETFFAAADREKLDRCAAHMLRFFEQLAELRGNAALDDFSPVFSANCTIRNLRGSGGKSARSFWTRAIAAADCSTCSIPEIGQRCCVTPRSESK